MSERERHKGASVIIQLQQWQ